MSAHLGEQVTALVDGQLHGAGRDRALAHVAGCRRCADDVKSSRAAREALRARLREVRPDPEFMSRLLALSSDTDVGPSGTSSQTSGPGLRTSERLPARSVALCGDLRGDGRAWWVRGAALGALAATGVVAAGLFALGARPVVVPSRGTSDALSVLAAAPQVTGADDRTSMVALQSAVPSADVPTDDVFAWMDDEGWQRPATLPAGLVLTQVRFVGERDAILEVDLESPLGRIVVREQRGQLDLSSLEGTALTVVNGKPVYIVLQEPVHLVWQSADTVVDVVSEMSLDNVLQLVSAFTVDEFDTGFPARVGRGWSTLTGVR